MLFLHQPDLVKMHNSNNTIVSQASAHGGSQLKPEKSGVGPYTEEVLE